MNTIRLLARRMYNNNKRWEPLKKVGIIGVPFEKGQKKYGVSIAPAAIRDAGLIEELQEIGMRYSHFLLLVSENPIQIRECIKQQRSL